MKRTVTLLMCGLASSLWMIGCAVNSPDSPQLGPLGGARTFTRYMAIGNSLTAGFMDAGLHVNAQQESYPALVAKSLGFDPTLSSDADFFQPYINHPGIGSSDTGDPSLVAGVLHWTGTSIDVVGITPIAEVPTLLLSSLTPVAYNNLGVPGATTSDVSNATDSSNSQSPGNTFFDFILRNPDFGAGTTMLQQTIGRGPTLVTVWIGNNDILAGALSGTPQPGVNVTPAGVFADSLEALLTRLEEGITVRTGFAPTVLLLNVPGDLPYFLPVPVFETILQESVPFEEAGVIRVRFPAITYVSEGGALPLPGDLTISQAEWDVVNSAIEDYNVEIAAAATAHRATVVDINAMVDALFTTGFGGFDGEHFVVDPTNPAFSLDGIHFNNFGFGLVANEVLKVLEQVTGEDLGRVDVGSLSWDPTYGVTRVGPGNRGLMTPAAAHAMDAIFRRFRR